MRENAFLDRNKIIRSIKKILKEDKSKIKTIALTGIGGSGKTTIARQYARQHTSKSIVREINAQTPEVLKNSFVRIAFSLAASKQEEKQIRGWQSINDTKVREEKILSFVRGKLNSYTEWLLIYDNMEIKLFADIKDYIPKNFENWGNGTAIITTRDSTIDNTSYIKPENVIPIKSLDETEALTLFSRIYSSELLTTHEKEEILKLLKEIPPYPLDVSTAAYYIKDTKINYATYIERIKKYSENFNTAQESLLKEINDYAKTRYGIITFTIDNLIKEENTFQELLLYISLLDSQNIPCDLLSFYKNELKVESLIRNLSKHSFITSRTTGDFSLHRSTQEIILIYLVRLLELEKNNKFVVSTVNSFEKYMIDIINKQDLSKTHILVTHCEVFLNHNNLLSEGMRCSISGILGCVYFYLTDYEKAKKIFEGCLPNIYRCGSVREGLVLGHLGAVCERVGEYERAKELLEKSIEAYSKELPEDSIEIINVSRNLGNTYRKLGDHNKAKELLEKNIKICKINFSDHHFGLAKSLVFLGALYNRFGEYEEAKKQFEESCKIYKDYDLADHQIDRAQALRFLGSAYRRVGDCEKDSGDHKKAQENYEKAKGLIEESYELSQQYLPHNHVDLTWYLLHLGNLHKSLEDYKEAKRILEECFEINKKNYKEGHVEIARILVNLGEVCFLKGNKSSDPAERERDFQLAEKYLNEALAILQKNDYPDMYMCLESIAEFYIKKSGYLIDTQEKLQLKNKAIDCLTRALKNVIARFESSSPHIARIQSKLDAQR